MIHCNHFNLGETKQRLNEHRCTIRLSTALHFQSLKGWIESGENWTPVQNGRLDRVEGGDQEIYRDCDRGVWTS